jgi:hypothetical protein
VGIRVPISLTNFNKFVAEIGWPLAGCFFGGWVGEGTDRLLNCFTKVDNACRRICLGGCSVVKLAPSRWRQLLVGGNTFFYFIFPRLEPSKAHFFLFRKTHLYGDFFCTAFMTFGEEQCFISEIIVAL